MQAADRVLEVGFGPGLAIADLAHHLTDGCVYGIDHSDLMLHQATKRNATAVRQQRVELIHTSVDQLPRFDAPLDAILAVNSLGFWPNPDEQLYNLRNLLRPGGRIALATQPRCPAPTKPPQPERARNSETCSTKQASPTPAFTPSTSIHLSPASSPPTPPTDQPDPHHGSSTDSPQDPGAGAAKGTPIRT